MRLDFSGERVLAVVAHPDDAEYLCAGTLARAKADGAAIGICVLCKGDRGQPARPIRNLAAVRRREMAKAAVMLGAMLLRGDFGDAELTDGPKQRKKLIELYRRFRPTLVLAHCAQDYHSDHRAASAIAEAASWFCASAGHKSTAAVMDKPPVVWQMDTLNMIGFEPGFYVDISDYVDLKRRMLACHKSQLQPGRDGGSASIEDQMLRQCQMRGAQAGIAAAEAFCIHPAWKRIGAW